jgi:tRNA modification GTPase
MNGITTRVVQLTPKGRGAIASLAVDGPQALAAVAACFRPHTPLDLTRLRLGRITVGRWHGPATATGSAEREAAEEVVVCHTQRDQVEVHCHGGQAAIAAIMRDLERCGCIVVDGQQFEPDTALTRLQRAAAHALAQASTERTSLILLDQYHGALDRALRQLADDLATNRPARARQLVSELLGRADVGLHLTTPWQVVLAGRPNVGKSSLINALVGYQRAVVYDTPGTTRDVVRVATAIDGWPVELSDTAGIRSADDPLEALGVDRARQQLRQADLLVVVGDATAPAVDISDLLAHVTADVLHVLNKCDLCPEWVPDDQTLLTSAVTGQGVADLVRAIGRRLVPDPPTQGSAVPFQRDQVQTLTAVLATLDRNDLAAARHLLSAWENGRR